MKSTVIPTLTVSVAVVAAYHMGKASGLGGEQIPPGSGADLDFHSAGQVALYY